VHFSIFVPDVLLHCRSYETLRKHTEALAGVCDVLVCDEGHRLKATGGNKTIDALKQLGCKRRIVLTGTPLQVRLEASAMGRLAAV
jgi:SNF2 family DNA or RNA helicase